MLMSSTESMLKWGMLKLLHRVESKNVIWFSQMVADKDSCHVLWKPSNGEFDVRPGIDGRFYLREILAYEISKMLDISVPETVVHSYAGVVGSVQRWMGNAVIGDYINMDYLIFMDLEQWRNAAAFDYVIGNNDRHSGNWLLHPTGKLWLIDHGSSLPEINDCWRGSLAILRPMINRKIAISDMFKDKLIEHKESIKNYVRGMGLGPSIPALEERITLLLKAERFSDLVIKR